MNFLYKIKKKIKSKENFFTRFIYDFIMCLKYLRLPAPRFIFKPLLILHLSLTRLFRRIIVALYFQPLFLMYLTNKPKRLRIERSLPFVIGVPIISLGDDCRFNGSMVISAKSGGTKQPSLIIGNRVGIQFNNQIFIGTEINIGDDCRLAEGCVLRGYTGHPVNPERRLLGLAEDSHEFGPITLKNNVWLGNGVKVNANVTIGENSVIASGSIVTKDIPDNVLAGGIPAKIIRQI